MINQHIVQTGQEQTIDLINHSVGMTAPQYYFSVSCITIILITLLACITLLLFKKRN